MAKASEELLETQRKNKWTETPGIQHVLNFTLSPSGRHDIGETTPSFDESEVHIRAWKRLEEQFWDNATYFMHPALEYILTYFLPGKLKQKQEYFKHRLMTTVYNAIREYANYRREFEL